MDKKYRFANEIDSFKNYSKFSITFGNLKSAYGHVRECRGKQSVLVEVDPSVMGDLPFNTIVKNLEGLYKACGWISSGLNEKCWSKLVKLLEDIDGGKEDTAEDWLDVFSEDRDNLLLVEQMSLFAKTYLLMRNPDKFVLSADSIQKLCCSLLVLDEDKRNCWANDNIRYMKKSDSGFPVQAVGLNYIDSGGGYFRQISSGREILRHELDDICRAYNSAVIDNNEDPLWAVPMFIADFLMISPFESTFCNNILSRLLTMVLLAQGGYDIYKYISFELVSAHLKKNSSGLSGNDYFIQSFFGAYSSGKNYFPYVEYVLNHLILAYEYLFYRILPLGGRDRKAKCIKALFKNEYVRLTKSEIHDLCYEISVPTIESVLGKLSGTAGYLDQVGRGRTTSYQLHNPAQ